MRFDDDYNSYDKGIFQTKTAAVCIIGILAVIVIVFVFNVDNIKRNGSNSGTSATPSVTISETVGGGASVSEDDFVLSYSTLHPEDLDFYQMYPEVSESVSVSEEVVEEVAEDDPATDGKHTLITYDDGKEEWVSISKYITKNIYDYTNLADQDGIKEYIYNGRKISSFGVDISKDQDYIDFNKLKKAGVDFVMIRVGARGYASGQLMLDDYFEDNFRRASNAGLDIGVYFLSQAITEEEAEEEAELVIEKIETEKLLYPVAFIMEYAEGETARVEALGKSEKTMIARAFLKKIDEAGYKAVIYGKKAWLMKYLELNKIVSDFDVWLSEETDIPTYPYEFTMWQYNKRGRIDGIKGDVGFNLCFVDYSLR
ncbi:MAG: hypothetical protein MJ107_03645 [Lachnospiraceae bacterium]|nr:hypothetical protein [Lachnospiraceae bacterium]